MQLQEEGRTAHPQLLTQTIICVCSYVYVFSLTRTLGVNLYKTASHYFAAKGFQHCHCCCLLEMDLISYGDYVLPGLLQVACWLWAQRKFHSLWRRNCCLRSGPGEQSSAHRACQDARTSQRSERSRAHIYIFWIGAITWGSVVQLSCTQHPGTVSRH